MKIKELCNTLAVKDYKIKDMEGEMKVLETEKSNLKVQIDKMKRVLPNMAKEIERLKATHC